MDSIRQMLSVLFVLGLLAGVLWWLRTKGMANFTVRRGPGKSLRVIERITLTPQHSLHLVHVSERDILIATSPAGCTILETIPGPTEASVEKR